MASLPRLLAIITLVLLAGFIRIYNLGYSEYQDDEKKAFIRHGSNVTASEFLLAQRKGPIQFFVTSATVLLTDDPKNEFVIRLPFAIANLISVVVTFVIFRELFNSTIVAFFGSLIFATNGFLVGFSRIAQYQSLNILFSLTSIYFFLLLNKTNRRHLLFSSLGTAFFCLSILSHWDAIFYIVPIALLYIKFLANKLITKEIKKNVTLFNIILGCILLLPFLVPYVITQVSHTSNIDYFNRRVGFSDYDWGKHKFILELYNPYVTLYFLPFLAFFSLFKAKKNFNYVAWFVINFLVIRFLMEKPGTHVYNYVIPLIFMSTAGIDAFYKKKWVFATIFLPLIIGLAFLYYQSYIIFVDNTKEYPWEEKVILSYNNIHWETMPYEKKEVLTFGFPHYRNWKEVNRIVSSDPENCSYISNEGKEISQAYMDSKYGILSTRSCYYIVEVKRPFITRGNGMAFVKTIGKNPIYEYEKDGEIVTKLYKVSTK